MIPSPQSSPQLLDPLSNCFNFILLLIKLTSPNTFPYIIQSFNSILKTPQKAKSTPHLTEPRAIRFFLKLLQFLTYSYQLTSTNTYHSFFSFFFSLGSILYHTLILKTPKLPPSKSNQQIFNIQSLFRSKKYKDFGENNVGIGQWKRVSSSCKLGLEVNE